MILTSIAPSDSLTVMFYLMTGFGSSPIVKVKIVQERVSLRYR